jgi:hypothetical protein
VFIRKARLEEKTKTSKIYRAENLHSKLGGVQKTPV